MSHQANAVQSLAVQPNTFRTLLWGATNTMLEDPKIMSFPNMRRHAADYIGHLFEYIDVAAAIQDADSSDRQSKISIHGAFYKTTHDKMVSIYGRPDLYGCDVANAPSPESYADSVDAQAAIECIKHHLGGAALEAGLMITLYSPDTPTES